MRHHGNISIRDIFVVTFALALPSTTTLADNASTPTQNATSPFEASIATALLYSQENMRYFFADFDSRVRPQPANAYLFMTAKRFSSWGSIHTVLSLPNREEVVHREGQADWTYYYPKSLLVGWEAPVAQTDFVTNRAFLEHRLGIGLNTPISRRFLNFIAPTLQYRAVLTVTPSVFLMLGVGYTGNVSRGVWSVPFGVGNRF